MNRNNPKSHPKQMMPGWAVAIVAMIIIAMLLLMLAHGDAGEPLTRGDM